MARLNSILVLGAGELGLEVIKALTVSPARRQQGTTISVLLRQTHANSTSDVSTIQALGCSIVRHNVADLSIDQLAAIFAQYDAVVSSLGFTAGSGTQLKITKAALAAKVKRFFPWQFGVDYDVIGRNSGQPLFDEQLDVRDLLRVQHDVDWVIVSTGIFMSFVFEDAFGVVEGASRTNTTVRALGSWENGLSATAVEDIGKLTAALVFDDSIKQQVVHIAGASFTYADLADMVEKTASHPVTRELWSQQKLEQDLSAQPDDTMKKYRAAFALGKGVKWDFPDTYNAQRSIKVAGVEEWLSTRLARERS